MTIHTLLEQKHMTKYSLSKNSGVPYTTVNDICNGKAELIKCTAETVYKLASTLDITMESLLKSYLAERSSFELFKSHVCHTLKELGDIDFIIQTLEDDDITKYYERKWFAESLYLLAMLDYISNQNKIPLCSKYDAYRKCRLKDTIFPASIRAEAAVTNNTQILEQAKQEALPEFMRFNIVESEVRNVV